MNLPTDRPQKSRLNRWKGPLLLLVLLTCLNVLSLTDRFLIAAFGSQITAELGLSNQQFGLVTGFGFVLFYALAGPLMGILADRFGASRLLALGIFVFSAMTALTGQAKSFLGIIIPRAFVGIGEATLNPAASSVLSKAFDQRHRATVLGLYFMGGHIGIALSYQIGGIKDAEWRSVFLILGAVGLLLSGLLVLLTRLMPNSLSAPGEAQTSASTASMAALAKQLLNQVKQNPTLRLAIMGMALVHLIYAEIQFLQIWLVSERGFTPQEASGLYGRVYLLTALPASLLGGILADKMANRAKMNRATFVFYVLVVTLPMVILFRFAPPESDLFLAGMIASIALFTLPYGAMIATILDEVSEGIRASATAMTMFIINVFVIGIASYGLGLASDLFTAAGRAEPLTSALLIVDSVLILSAAVFWRLHRKINQATATLI